MKKLFYLCMLPISVLAQFTYPVARHTEQIDDYHGVKIADPYRWLEDDRSAETAEWVKQQNALSLGYLNKIPYQEAFRQRIEQVFNYPKYSIPSRKNDLFYFYKNDGLQNQSVLYRQKGLDGTPEMVIDPNKLSTDATTRLVQFNLSKDGKYAAVALSMGGSDWQEISVMNMQTMQYLTDKVAWVKVSGIAWQGNGFYYSRYPKPEGSALAAKNENHQVFYHTVGASQEQDELVYEDKINLQRFHGVYVSEDEKFAYLSISERGKGKDGNALYVKELGQKNFMPIVAEITNNSYSVVENIDKTLLIQTNQNAPNEKIESYNTQTKAWADFLAERAEPLQGANVTGGKLFVTYLKDVTTRVYVYNLKGILENEIILPGLGTASGFGGNIDDSYVFYTFTSFNYPPTIFRYDIATQQSTIFRTPEIGFNATDFETKQVFYTSKDGTKVPMFIVYKKGLKLHAQNPTLLYGYGGFNISLNPAFSPTLIPFLEQGGVYASACLRGGSEYGEKWHEQGMKLKKQNVFDDFIAAAEYLIANNYCDSHHLALRGGSNGGLLVGAVVNQRPDLCQVAIPQVGVMDMLRFHKFTIGWNWIADYGSADNLQEFKVLSQYSPLHNIKTGVKYPAMLVTTADHDDRVVPAHSFKYIATLQEKAAANTTNPLFIRIDTNSGHGSSNTKKNIELTADIYAFIFKNMGITPTF